MPIHDWSHVKADIFHDFHHAWISSISNSLNSSLIPSDFYAIIEPMTNHSDLEAVTFEHRGNHEEIAAGNTVAVALRPPRARYIMQSDAERYIRRQSRVAIRSSEDDRIVALIEIVSPGNKSSKRALDIFVEKAADSLAEGYHLLTLDLHPPTPRDPHGLHGRIWDEIADETYTPSPRQTAHSRRLLCRLHANRLR